jgi:hypothetical protein
LLLLLLLLLNIYIINIIITSSWVVAQKFNILVVK